MGVDEPAPRRGINTGCLEGRRILVATGGSISIYRVPDIIREMRREGAKVKVAMGKASQALISHEVFRWASGNDVITEVSGRLEHISDVEGSDALVLMPASFDTIGKCANGIADEVQPLMFSNAVGSGVPVLFVPAMHQGMFRSPALRRNTDILRSMGALFVEPVVEEGKAKLAGPAEVIDAVARALAGQRGGRYLVVSGRGEEVIDPVRVVTNRSTGLMGYWISRWLYRLGAGAIEYVGNCSRQLPSYVNFRPAHTAEEFEEGVSEAMRSAQFDGVFLCAALPDFTLDRHHSKIPSSSEVTLKLTPRRKMVEALRPLQARNLVAFRLTDSGDSDVWGHFAGYEPDVVVSNYYDAQDGAFGDVSNRYVIHTRHGSFDLGVMPKELAARRIVEHVMGVIP